MARRNKILAGAAALSAVLVLAQKETYGQDASAKANGADRQQVAVVGLPPGTPINVALEQTLDSKNLVPGANVTAKTTEEVKQDGKVVLPKGTKVLGHVTVSRARSKGDNDSTLALEFDRAELKGGQHMPLEATIEAMASAPNAAPEGSNDFENMGRAGATANPAKTNRGNMPGGMSSGAAATTPRTNEGIAGTSADTTATASGGGEANRSGALKPNSHGVFGLSGLSLDESTVNSGQGALIHSVGKTVHLDGGTRLLLVTQGATTAER